MTKSINRSAPRFVVRQGCKGWMVYDRQRKGPALVGTDLAANLTKEQAERTERSLTDPNARTPLS